MNEVMVSSFFEELIKIAQESTPDPRAEEMAELRENPKERSKDINREVMKQQLKNMAVIGAGAGLGLGAGTAANIGLGRLAQRYGKEMPKWAPYAVQGLVVPAMAAGSGLAYQRMREKNRELLEEARQRGEAQ